MICLTILSQIMAGAQTTQNINIEKNSNVIYSLNQNGTTWYVGGDGPGNFTRIHKAIDAASEGDTIYVFNGSYNESFTIDKSIILRGEDKETTKIIGGWQFTIVVKSNNVIIHSFTIDNGWDSSDNKYFGISIGGDNTTVYDNILTNNTKGISLGFSNNHFIFNNTFHGNGIILSDSYNNDIRNNILNGKNLVYLEDASNKIIDPNTSQVILVNCTNITVSGLYLLKTNVGVQLLNTNNCHIFNNIISEGVSGISLTYSNSNIISGNNISFCKYEDGIHIDFSSSNNFINDNIIEFDDAEVVRKCFANSC